MRAGHERPALDADWSARRTLLQGRVQVALHLLHDEEDGRRSVAARVAVVDHRAVQTDDALVLGQRSAQIADKTRATYFV